MVDPALAGDDFDPVVSAIAYDSNNSGFCEDGVDTLISSGSGTPDIASDGSLKLYQ